MTDSNRNISTVVRWISYLEERLSCIIHFHVISHPLVAGVSTPYCISISDFLPSFSFVKRNFFFFHTVPQLWNLSTSVVVLSSVRCLIKAVWVLHRLQTDLFSLSACLARRWQPPVRLVPLRIALHLFRNFPVDSPTDFQLPLEVLCGILPDAFFLIYTIWIHAINPSFFRLYKIYNHTTGTTGLSKLI